MATVLPASAASDSTGAHHHRNSQRPHEDGAVRGGAALGGNHAQHLLRVADRRLAGKQLVGEENGRRSGRSADGSQSLSSGEEHAARCRGYQRHALAGNGSSIAAYWAARSRVTFAQARAADSLASCTAGLKLLQDRRIGEDQRLRFENRIAHLFGCSRAAIRRERHPSRS